MRELGRIVFFGGRRRIVMVKKFMVLGLEIFNIMRIDFCLD